MLFDLGFLVRLLLIIQFLRLFFQQILEPFELGENFVELFPGPKEPNALGFIGEGGLEDPKLWVRVIVVAEFVAAQLARQLVQLVGPELVQLVRERERERIRLRDRDRLETGFVVLAQFILDSISFDGLDQVVFPYQCLGRGRSIDRYERGPVIIIIMIAIIIETLLQ
ncbi:hypothetical protein PGTUg99_027451 [Puccinia graminis f. sp. tritici]|uniref:Secreted protein n=1 Tax=Puccinia graminis f. sp. tritici TaxID=56615 RepID=A0A5B0SLY9_PUCGR|nr:hypothetical protein PGTUg99_027451 [Puccinia graminis f. sp. tritici]